MALNQVETAPPTRAEGGTATGPAAKTGGWGKIILTLLVLGAAGGGGWWYMTHREEGKPKSGAGAGGGTEGGEEIATASLPVEVVHPSTGGIERLSTQPGSVHAFEYADLYAKVSGFLKEQSVDIGDTVKLNQVLAVIDDPEIYAARHQAEAALETAQAKVKLARQKITTSKAVVETAKAEVKRYESEAAYRKLEFERYKDLFDKGQAVQRQRVDEEREHYETSMASEAASKTLVKETEAKVEEAKVDLIAAEANVDVAKADLEKAKVFVEYTKILSPYDGVITKRSYHRGAFIRSASDGNGVPLLSVARTDLMRVITKIPDRDVPFVDLGDPAIVKIDALGGEEFKGPDVKVSRFADVEDPEDRTMRTEVDLKNTDGKLRDGMYGQLTVVLESTSKALTIPSSSLASEEGGAGAVFVVHNKKIERKAIKVGRDNGLQMEVMTGLTPEDEVVVRPTPSMAPGMAAVPKLVSGAITAPKESSE